MNPLLRARIYQIVQLTHRVVDVVDDVLRESRPLGVTRVVTGIVANALDVGSDNLDKLACPSWLPQLYADSVPTDVRGIPTGDGLGSARVIEDEIFFGGADPDDVLADVVATVWAQFPRLEVVRRSNTVVVRPVVVTAPDGSDIVSRTEIRDAASAARSGLGVVFVGPEGCGKTTAARGVANELDDETRVLIWSADAGVEVIEVLEPDVVVIETEPDQQLIDAIRASGGVPVTGAGDTAGLDVEISLLRLDDAAFQAIAESLPLYVRTTTREWTPAGLRVLVRGFLAGGTDALIPACESARRREQ
jgi:hypothetical protein